MEWLKLPPPWFVFPPPVFSPAMLLLSPCPPHVKPILWEWSNLLYLSLSLPNSPNQFSDDLFLPRPRTSWGSASPSLTDRWPTNHDDLVTNKLNLTNANAKQKYRLRSQSCWWRVSHKAKPTTFATFRPLSRLRWASILLSNDGGIWNQTWYLNWNRWPWKEK